MATYGTNALEMEDLRKEAAASIVPGWRVQAYTQWLPRSCKPQRKHLVAEAQRRGLNVTFRAAQDYIDWLADNPRLSGEDSIHQQAEQTLSVVSIDKNGETTKRGRDDAPNEKYRCKAELLHI